MDNNSIKKLRQVDRTFKKEPFCVTQTPRDALHSSQLVSGSGVNMTGTASMTRHWGYVTISTKLWTFGTLLTGSYLLTTQARQKEFYSCTMLNHSRILVNRDERWIFLDKLNFCLDQLSKFIILWEKNAYAIIGKVGSEAQCIIFWAGNELNRENGKPHSDMRSDSRYFLTASLTPSTLCRLRPVWPGSGSLS